MPVPSHVTTSPAFVGVVVDEPMDSCASTVHCGGVLSTVTVVVAMLCAFTVFSFPLPMLIVKINANDKSPRIHENIVTLPAVETLFMLYAIHNNELIVLT